MRRRSARRVEPVGGDGAVTEAAAETPARGRGGVVGAVDRYFALVWIGLYALLPVTGASAEAFKTSFDQSRDLEALRSVLADGHADAIAENLIGPAYIATAAAIHTVARLSPEDSLIALTRLSYVLAIAICLILVRVTVRRLTPGLPPPSVSLSAQVAFTVLVFAAGTWHWSDVPWSHFYAALLAVGFYALRFGPGRSSTLSLSLAGAVLALLALTRSFEFMAVVAAWALALGVLALLRIHAVRRPAAWRLAFGAGAFLVVVGAVYAVTGKRNSFLLYQSGGQENYGDLLPEEVATIPSLDLVHVPLKVVQLFLDPCFYSLCSLHEYAGIRAAWRQPLSVQLPALLLIPLCVVAVGLLLAGAARRRQAASGRTRELQLLAEMTIAASGLTLGYLASSWSSSSALRFGFARDFMLAALLAGVVGVCVLAAWLYGAVLRRGEIRIPGTGRRLSPARSCVAAVSVGTLVLMAAVVVTRTYGLPQIESRHLASLEYHATCRSSTCRIEIQAMNPGGERISIPSASLLTFGCGSNQPRFSLYAADPAEGVAVPLSCAEPRLVAAWPAVMGVPPSSEVLRAVAVSNAA
jgi:hypothetical protein